jgi:hypothetical protein
LKTLLYIALIIALLPLRASLADELKLTPSLTIKEDYNDNIFFSTVDSTSDFVSTLSPGIELSDRNERLDASLLLRLNGILYAKTTDLDAVDQYYRGGLRFLLTPRSSISASAGYILDSQPDREIETTGLVLGSVKRHRQQYSLAGEMALTETTSADLAYSYQQDDYNNNRFSDLEYHDGSLSLTHDLDRLLRSTKAMISFDYAHYISSVTLVDSLNSTSIVDNYSLTVGMSHSVSELWSVQANAGGRYTVSKFQSWGLEGYQLVDNQGLILAVPVYSPLNQKSHQWGWVGQAALSYNGEKNQGSLSFNSDVQPASGQTSGTTIRTGVVADMRRRFTYELSGGVSVGYYLNKSNPGAIAGQAINEETVLVSPNVHYQFSRDMYLEASYRFTKVFYNITNTDANRNSFFVTFYIQNPFFM